MTRWISFLAGCVFCVAANARPDVTVITVTNPLSPAFMEQMGQLGVTLSHYAPAPAVSADRAALLVGRDPIRLGIAYNNIRPWDNAGIHPEESLLVDAFNEAGYYTAFLGNWGLGHAQYTYHPLHRGFDQFAGQLLLDADVKTPFKAFNGIDLQESGKPLTQIPAGTPDVNHWVINNLKTLLKSEASPVFSVLSLSNHNTQTVTSIESFIEDLIVTHPDSLFVLLNRPTLTETANESLLATPEDQLSSAVFIWPDQLPAGTHLSALTSPLDILPTIIDLLNLDSEQAKSLDGEILTPLLRNASVNHRPQYLARTLTLVHETPGYGHFQLTQFDTQDSEQTSMSGYVLSQRMHQGFSSLTIEQELCAYKDDQSRCEIQNQPDQKNKAQQLAEVTRQRRALHPVNGIRNTVQPPEGWRAPVHWQSITLDQRVLQNQPAPGDVPAVARLPLDYQLGDKGRIIYDCEPKWWAFGLCF